MCCGWMKDVMVVMVVAFVAVVVVVTLVQRVVFSCVRYLVDDGG